MLLYQCHLFHWLLEVKPEACVCYDRLGYLALVSGGLGSDVFYFLFSLQNLCRQDVLKHCRLGVFQENNFLKFWGRLAKL